MVQVAERTLKDVDVILWLVEPTTFAGAGERHIAEQLGGLHIPVILVINKVDTVKKEEILKAIDTYRKLYEFDEIIPVSALRGSIQETSRRVFLNIFRTARCFTTRIRLRISRSVRSWRKSSVKRRFMPLDAEIPHGIAVAVDKMRQRPGKNRLIDIDATIICEKDSHKGIIIGRQGAMLKKIGSNARFELERMLEAKINLKLWVKVKRDWRDSDFLIKNFGYDKKEI